MIDPGTESQDAVWRRLAPVAVVAAALLSHGTYLLNGFTWLDHGDIEGGRALGAMATWHLGLLSRFGETGFYRPVVAWLHALDAWAWDGHAWGFHATNVILHALAALAVLRLARSFIGLSARGAAFVALAFAVHPLSWLPVGAISYRSEPALVATTLLALDLHIRFHRDGGVQRLLGAAGLLALALATKETALVWFVALLAIQHGRSPLAHGRTSGARRAIAATAVYAAVIAGWVALRQYAVPELWRVEALGLRGLDGLWMRLQAIGLRLPELAGLGLPALSDALPKDDMAPLPIVAAVLLVIACIGAATRWGTRAPTTRALLLLAVIAAPALNIVPLPRFTSPHYWYLAPMPVAALAWLAGLEVHRRRPQLRWAMAAAGAVWLLVMAAITAGGGPRFRNDVTLFSPEIKQDNDYLEGHFQLAETEVNAGRLEEAATRYEHILERNPKVIAYVDGEALLTNLAAVRFRLGRYEAADELLAVLVESTPSPRRAVFALQRAHIAAERGDHAAVDSLLDEEDALVDRPEVLLLHARALHRLGRHDEAIGKLRAALPLVKAERRADVQALIDALQTRIDAGAAQPTE